MSQPTQEIELKFLCAPEDLGRVLAAAPAGADDTRELISVYFDTPERDLEKVGASLRVRESRGHRVQTLKRGDGLAREEHEASIPGDAPDPSLGPLPGLLPAGVQTPLRPAFHVRVTRRERLLRFADAEIELALDQGEVRGAQRASPISEVELELKSGPPKALFALARSLSQAAPLYLSFATKSQRGQALVAGATVNDHRRVRAGLSRDATAGDLFQEIARVALAAIATNAEVLRERPDPDAVHKLRVAARTLRSALSTFRKVVQDDAYAPLKLELRWLGKACDRARNLDVFAAELLPQEPAAVPSPPPQGLEPLALVVEIARGDARKEVTETVSSARFRALLIDAAAWVEMGAWREKPAAGRRAAEFGARALSRRRKRLLKDARKLADISDEARQASSGSMWARPRAGSSPSSGPCRTSSAPSTTWPPRRT
jgi:triphosphatase